MISHNKKLFYILTPIVAALIIAIIAGILYNNEEKAEKQKEAEVVKLVDSQELKDTDATQSDLALALKVDIGEESINTLESKSTLNQHEGNTGVTRYQLAYTLYNIIVDSDKSPKLSGYQLRYTDAERIPSKYIEPICYMEYTGIMVFERKFDGYKYVSKEYITNATRLCREYIANYSDSLDDKLSEKQETRDRVADRETVAAKAKEVLEQRKVDDTLNGQSVALFRNPKTLGELESNILAITETEMSELEEEGNTLEYVNLDEALIDYSMAEDYITERSGGVMKIAGVTRLNEQRVAVKKLDPEFNSIISQNIVDLADRLKLPLGYIFFVDDYKVVGLGKYLEVDGKQSIMTDYKGDIDYIALMVNKKMLEGTYDITENTEYTYTIMVLVPVG